MHPRVRTGQGFVGSEAPAAGNPIGTKTWRETLSAATEWAEVEVGVLPSHTFADCVDRSQHRRGYAIGVFVASRAKIVMIRSPVIPNLIRSAHLRDLGHDVAIGDVHHQRLRQDIRLGPEGDTASQQGLIFSAPGPRPAGVHW